MIYQMHWLDLNLVVGLMMLVVVYIPGLLLSLVVHELGHAVAGWLAGVPLQIVRIGHGSLLGSFRVRTVRFEWRRWPFSGAVTFLPAKRSRLALVAVVLGGLAANLAVFAVMTAAWLIPAEENFGALVLALAQLPYIVGSALPYTQHWRGTRQPSDMLKLWQLLQPGSKPD